MKIIMGKIIMIRIIEIIMTIYHKDNDYDNNKNNRYR